MLKRRLIACLVLHRGIVVQSIRFRRYLPIGQLGVAVEFLHSWGIDEIVIQDITARRDGRPPDTGLVADAVRDCFVPLTVGGGIRSLSDVEAVMHAGAEKVCVNTEALHDPDFITRTATVYGRQSVMVSIDCSRYVDGDHRVFADGGREPTAKRPEEWASEVEDRGAGEILINSIDRDGTGEGYDLDLIRRVTESVDIPVIALGGAGKADHLIEGLNKGAATAVAAGNFFHHTEHSVLLAKAAMRRVGIDIRSDMTANYESAALDSMGRLTKRPTAP